MTATNKHIPGKRIKTWHRAYKRVGSNISLRAFARMCRDGMDKKQADTASRWAIGKVAP